MKDQANLNTFLGILFNNQRFLQIEPKTIIKYSLKSEVLAELNKKYKLDKLVNNLDTINKVVVIMNYYSSRLSFVHDFPDLTDKDPLDLLNKNFEKENSSLNADQIMAIYSMLFCSLGIIHRIVYLNTYSPYDFFRYQLVEIFDENTKKWVVFDLLANCLFLDNKGRPKSAFELRVALAKNQLVIPVSKLADKNALEKIVKRSKHQNYLSLIAKYIFFFTLDSNQINLLQSKNIIVIPDNFDYFGYVNERLRFINDEIDRTFFKKEKEAILHKYKLYKNYLLGKEAIFESYKLFQNTPIKEEIYE